MNRPIAPPPAWAERLLRRHAPAGTAGLSIVGDLHEEYADRAERHPGAATAWYVGQVLWISTRLIAERRGAPPPPTARERKREMFGSIISDIRYGLRTLRRAPAFTIVSILTLTIGVGASAGIFSVVNGVLLRPLPFTEPEALVDLSVNTGGAGWYGSSVPEFIDYEEYLTSFASMGGYVTGVMTWGDSATTPQRINAVFVTERVIPTLGVPTVLGRPFTVEEDTPGNINFVIVTEGFWHGKLGGDPGVVGRAITLNGQPYEIVGVLPDSLQFPNADTELWLPFGLNRAQPNPRANHFVSVVARLRDGVTLGQAREELGILAERVIGQYPENYSGRGYRTRLISLHESVVGDTSGMLWFVFGGVMLVLLISAVNVASLVLSRGESRRRELAIRSAVGGARSRISRVLVAEGAVLGLVGAAAGILLAQGAVQVFVANPPPGVPRIDGVRVDMSTLLFTLGIVVITGTFFALWPALRVTAGNLRDFLSDSGRNSAGRRGERVRKALVVTEVALAAALAVGAGVMIRTLQNLYDVDAGFDPTGVLTFRVSPPAGPYPTPESRIGLYSELLTRLEGLPGVTGAAVAARLPLRNTYAQWSLEVEGRPTEGIGDAPDGYGQVTTPGYFDVMGIRPTQGRLYTTADGPAAPPVSVINATMARTFWPGEDPLGKRFKMFPEGWPMMEVIGVIPDVTELRLDEAPQPRFYVPYAQSATSAYFAPLGVYVTLKTGGDPRQLVAASRRVVTEVEPGAPVSLVVTLHEMVATSVASHRFAKTLLQTMGGVALFLACVGVYGVLSLSVTHRLPEIGLRKALGAEDGTLLTTVVRESLTLAVVGALIGVPLGIALTRAAGSLVFGVSLVDVPTLIAVLSLMGLAATAAAVVPAIRASRVDPVFALRGDG